MTIDEAIRELEANPRDVRFSRLLHLCVEFFGAYRVKGDHHIFRTPWPGEPRVNLQPVKGKAKPYQVRQVALALRMLKGK
jgi:hypothetical protein